MSDTPETDALVESINRSEARHEYDFHEMTWLARRLERERDEAQAALEGAKAISKQIAAEMLVNVKDIERERDKAREDAANYFARVVELERERDEARRYANDIDLCQGGVAPCDLAAKLMEKLDEARIQEDIHYQNYLQMQRERDEAREQLAIAKAERNAAHLKCHRIAEEIMAWLADPQPNNTTPPATSK